jgi:hypothetical protein
VPLKKLRSLSLRRRPWRFWSWHRGLYWLKMEATTGQGFMRVLACYKEIVKGQKMTLFHRTSVFGFFKISSGTLTSPPGLSDIGDDHPADRPTVQVEIPPPSCVFFVRFYISFS